MDSKVVNKAIRTEIRPFLKEVGFSKFTSRSSWRYNDFRIDLINFESFNAYNAAVQECTTFSFQIMIGIYIPAIPSIYGSIKEKNGILMPHYADCLFNRPLLKTLYQPELKHAFIWYIDKKGKYIQDAMIDVKNNLKNEGLPWFDQYDSLKTVLEKLEEQRKSCEKDGTWDYGKKPSPHWCYHAGYVAFLLKRYKTALNYLKRVEDYKYFKGIQAQLKKDINYAEKQLKKHLNSK